MRRYISILFALLLCVSALARTISKEEALQYASKFFDNAPGNKLTMVWTGQADKPLFYAFNNADGGFVIISAEDVAVPVLGYSYDRTFRADNMPENVKSWFSGIEKELSFVRKAGLKPSDKVRLQWENIGVRTKGPDTGKTIATAEWDQSSPYNSMLAFGPKGEYSVTGCVATAMAIFMRQMQWPKTGKGVLPSYTSPSEKYSIKGYSIDGYAYDWASMPLKDADVKKASSGVKQAIAQLMKDCGLSVYMDYSPYESAASNYAIGHAMAKYFRYTAGNKCLIKDNFEYSQWAAMLKAEIDADHSVLYSGMANAGGHMFIVDGYDEQGRWHLNWGWGGQDNGYFTMDLSIPGSYAFNCGQWAYFNMTPNPTGQEVAPGYDISMFDAGLSAPDGISVGKEFQVNAASIRNTGMGDFNGFVAFAVVGKNGTVNKILTDPIALKLAGTTEDGSYYLKEVSHSCKLDAPLSFGEGIMLVYKASEDDEYKVMPYNTDTTMGRLTSIPYFIDMPKTEYSAGETFAGLIKGGCEPLLSAEWYYDGLKGRYNVLTAGTHEIKVVITTLSGKEETLVQEIVVK